MKKTYNNAYRSGLEADIASKLRDKKIPFEYEKLALQYTIPASNRRYTPDFKLTTKSGKTLIIEAKGIWVYSDRYKHLLIRNQHPELDIRFVFSNSKSKIRKGSKTTYADICNGKGVGAFKGVKWKYSDTSIPEEWLNE